MDLEPGISHRKDLGAGIYNPCVQTHAVETSPHYLPATSLMGSKTTTKQESIPVAFQIHFTSLETLSASVATLLGDSQTNKFEQVARNDHQMS